MRRPEEFNSVFDGEKFFTMGTHWIMKPSHMKQKNLNLRGRRITGTSSADMADTLPACKKNPGNKADHWVEPRVDLGVVAALHHSAPFVRRSLPAALLNSIEAHCRPPLRTSYR